jgi:hypothetical protein
MTRELPEVCNSMRYVRASAPGYPQQAADKFSVRQGYIALRGFAQRPVTFLHRCSNTATFGLRQTKAFHAVLDMLGLRNFDDRSVLGYTDAHLEQVRRSAQILYLLGSEEILEALEKGSEVLIVIGCHKIVINIYQHDAYTCTDNIIIHARFTLRLNKSRVKG